MDGTFLTILIIIVISIGVFALIKKVCKPIKTVTAILLIIPTVATCGIVLFIYKFFRNSFEITSYHEKNSSSATNAHSITSYDIPTFDEPKKTEKKKPARAFTDVSGKTAYYDDKGNLIGSSKIIDLVKKYLLMLKEIMQVKDLVMDWVKLHTQIKTET